MLDSIKMGDFGEQSQPSVPLASLCDQSPHAGVYLST